MLRKKLETWLRKQFYASKDEGECVRIALKHSIPGSKSSDVASIDVPENPGDEFIGECSADIENTALTDAAGIGGVQTYVVLGYFGENKSHSSRLTFRVDGEESDDGDGVLSSEPPNKTGLMSQMMRHVEASMKMLISSQAQNMSSSQRTIHRLNERLEQLETDRIKTIELVENLVSMRHERELDWKKQETREHMLGEAVKSVKLLAPVIAHKLTGPKNGSASNQSTDGDPVREIVKNFASSLQPKQLADLQKVLQPDQLAAFMELATILQDEEKDQEKTDA